ncbi:hypothetical protein [Stenotrophomonas sp.]|uniref:hypothetical protein n=1 Tax=Stenotrophomonas sp. TaxID=69392 RepID=UPI002FC7CFBA
MNGERDTKLWQQWAGLAVLVAVVLGVYWPGLTGAFIFDDYSTIVENTRLHVDTLQPSLIWQAATSFDPGGTFGARPLAMATLAANHALGGLNPWGYKLVGLLVHAGNSLLVYLLVSLLLGASTGVTARSRRLVALTVALLWAVHPIQVSSVLYVVQRMETLAATFMLAALICYLHGRLRQIQGARAWPWLLAAGLLTLTGLLSKETAVLVPVYTLAMELTVLRFAAASSRVQRGWQLLYVAMVAVGLVVFVAMVIPRYWTEHYLARNFGTAERLLTQLRVLPMYLQQMFLPTPGTLTFYYDNVQPSRGLLQPVTTLLGGLLLAGLLAAALWLRRRAPLFALGVMWFLASHLLTSNVIGLELVFEHRNYLALLGVLLALSDLVLRLPAASRALVVPAAAAALVVTCLGLTLIRAATWGNPLLLATELAVENRGSARASADLAARYVEMSDGYSTSPFINMAIAEFERGAALPNASIISDQGLILVAAHNGRPVPDAWWDRLLTKVRTGMLSPETTGALFSLLANRYKGVPLDDAKLVQAFGALFERATMPPYSYAQVGDFAMVHARDEAFADAMFVRAIETSGGQPEYARKVIDTLEGKGWHRQAALARAKAQAMGMPGIGAAPAAEHRD